MTWYATGTVTTTKNSKVVTGVGTQWANPLAGVSAGRMLILQTSTVAEIYEIASVQSDTQLTLADNYGGTTGVGKAYKIPTSPSVSIEQLALEIAASLAYHQQQLDGWNQILTGTGDITLTAPNGQKVTIKSQKGLADAITGAVKKSGDTMSGQLIFDYSAAGIKFKYENNSLMALRAIGDNFSFLYNDVAVNSWIAKLRYSYNANSWRFENIEDVTINGKSALKQGDFGIGGTAEVIADLNTIRQGGFYRTDGNTLNAPFSGIWGVTHINTGGNASSVNPSATQLAIHYSPAATIYVRSATSGKWNDWVYMISSSNSTVDSNGFYKKASPILRLYATDELDNADGFTKAGYGLVNHEAQGVITKRIGIGHYEIHGSLGLAKEGWYITLPEDANGNKKIFAEYSTDENNVITVKTYTKKFDFEKCEVVAGEPIDITEARWIDVRLEMPVIEIIEQEEPIPSTLNPIVISE